MFGLFTFFVSMMITFSAPLAAEELPPPRDQGLTQTLVMLGIAFVAFYLILWRPEQKRRNEIEEKRSALKKGDKIVAVGILGTVVKATEHTVVMKLYDGAKMEVLRQAVSDVEGDDETEQAEQSKCVELKP